MEKCFKKILPCFTAFAMVISFALVPAYAEYQSVTAGFFQGLIRSVTEVTSRTPFLGPIFSFVTSSASRSVCGVSDDQLHHAESYTGTATATDGTTVMTCRCKYCNQEFWAYPEDLSAAYDAYVSDLPASGYSSDGSLVIYSKCDSLFLRVFSDSGVGCPHYDSSAHVYKYPSIASQSFNYSFNCADSSFSAWLKSGASYISCSGFHQLFYQYSVVCPIDGMYSSIPGIYSDTYYLDSNYQEHEFEYQSYPSLKATYYSAGDIFSGHYWVCPCSRGSLLRFSVRFYPLAFKVVPISSSSSSTVYNINTRPTSITGGNYGIVGDNGQIVKVEDNSTIVNETNNTYFNPATGQTVPITGWNYDYSDRSYTVTTETGDTVTITYGDENITIKEGDTVYNVYYLADGSGSEAPPEACAHEWTETSRTEPTCTAPGKVSSTCSKCGQTKTEAIPALGHDWQVKQTVTTEYDDTGQLVQEGYILYECSRCQEQYKSTGGTAPPGGEGDSTTIGGLIEKLLGGIGDVAKGVIKGILTLLTKAVEALQGIGELFTSFVSSVVGIFGSFTDFLSAVFPFLPGEFVTIIELGLLLLVAAAVLRKFLS